MIVYTLSNEGSSRYHLFNGTIENAKKIPNSFNHYVIKCLGPQTLLANQRPIDYHLLNEREQWAIDKKLGILDWSGHPSD